MYRCKYSVVMRGKNQQQKCIMHLEEKASTLEKDESTSCFSTAKPV